MPAVQELYQQEIRQWSLPERLQLIALIAQDLAQTPAKNMHRITELRGLGKEIWQGVDAQQYVADLRSEWD